MKPAKADRDPKSATVKPSPRPIVLPKKPISDYVTDEPLETIMKHAKGWRRSCELKKLAKAANKSQLEGDFDACMHGYDMLRAEVKGRKSYAAYTWRIVRDKGLKADLEKWAMSKKKEPGFKLLLEHGQYDLTGEWLVLKYSTEFSPEFVAGARQSLLDAGVPAKKLADAGRGHSARFYC